MPRFDQEPGWADEVRRPAHKEDEQLEFALGERDHAFAVRQGAPVVVDLQPLQLPLARIPELQAPSISEELVFERVDVVFVHVGAGHCRQVRQLRSYPAQEILFEADHLLIDADPVPRVPGEKCPGVLAFEEPIGSQGGGCHRGAFWPSRRTNNRTKRVWGAPQAQSGGSSSGRCLNTSA